LSFNENNLTRKSIEKFFTDKDGKKLFWRSTKLKKLIFHAKGNKNLDVGSVDLLLDYKINDIIKLDLDFTKTLESIKEE
jgi:hypothetical protein